MYSIIIILAVIVGLLLIGIVLIQESKGGGLASGFSSSNALLGVRKTTAFIEKATWSLAASLVVLSILSVYASPKVQNASSVVTNMKSAPQLPATKTPAAPAPAK